VRILLHRQWLLEFLMDVNKYLNHILHHFPLNSKLSS
jgi:hypothetical protein